MRAPRTAIAALTMSAAALVSLAVKEGYVGSAMIPVKGDVPTVGFGMTERADGSPVQLGDRTNPVEALQRTLAYVEKTDAKIKRCVTAPLHQAEYDLMADFSYQYGVGALCKSSMVRRANAGDYAGSCKAYLSYKFVNGYDCSTPGNRICSDVWNRSVARNAKCMAVQ